MPSTADHVQFMAAVECIAGDFRASYDVSLGAGYHRSGVRRFGAVEDARAWLEDEARLYGAELVFEEQN